VHDLQARLAGAGISIGRDRPGAFGQGTESAVRAFQQARGLHVDGICGPQTWASLVEAGYRPGDRLLYHTSPMLRGDDIAALQRRLGALGFDAGRVDGIFGERTRRALVDFQRNAGLTTDAVCGPATWECLDRLGSHADDPEPVAGVREREALRSSPRTLLGRRIVIGDAGGLGALAHAVRRALGTRGAVALTVVHPDGSVQAQHANGVGADVYLGLAATEGDSTIAYYGAHGFESPGGRCLADALCRELEVALAGAPPAVSAMALPVLRETRMPAVVCELGPVGPVVVRGGQLAEAIGRAMDAWANQLDRV
jgi:N-acetylmuramoyl-L-alanine amidase